MTCRSGGRSSFSVHTNILLVCVLAALAWPTAQSRGATAADATLWQAARPASIGSGLSPLDPTDGPCEAVVGDEACYRRCGCEWCGPGAGHGCHTIPAVSGPANATGPCAGGKPGRRDAFWSCHREAVAWIAGGVVGAAATAFLVAVGVCWCHRKKVAARCCAWRRRYAAQRDRTRINDAAAGDDVWLGGYVSMPRYVNP
ncbi:hypothetical protein [Pandoravirus japonicus]|uniref:Uncharacterized protein n=1 Tax=Pandoravirus japonicus TaxID=2823154 RepID=A0A811BQY6_9VIRU|nr:hypothetical protein [Pandoravirus japonicus]